MKVLYLNPDRGIPVLGGKGASVHVREFIAALAGQGHEVALACATLGDGNAPPPAQLIHLPPPDRAPEIEAEAARLGLPRSALDDRVLRRELARLAHDRLLPAQVRTQIEARNFRPDFIYERHALFHHAGAVLAQALGVPRILEVNAPLAPEQERFRGLFLKATAIEIEHISFNGADGILAVSDAVARYIRAAGVAAEKIHIIPNGVDTARFHPNADGTAIRRSLGLGAGPVIGFIGSFKPWHGVAFLLDAFRSIARIDTRVSLLCIGDGPERALAQEMAAAEGLQDRIRFTGRIPYEAIPAYLAALDVSVAPYLPSADFYFSPLKIIESLAVGTPVVAPRIGQIEHLVDDGKTGLLFDPGDRTDFIAKVLKLILCPNARNRMAAAARARALSDFGWDRVINHTISDASNLIANRCAA